LTQAQGLRAAVVVNDFGDVNIDGSLIAGDDGDSVSLANGCMCCSLSGGFASAIATVLARAENLDAIIVEASGVAEPAKIAQYGQMFGLPLDGVLVSSTQNRSAHSPRTHTSATQCCASSARPI
jgi:G3E family GTPase